MGINHPISLHAWTSDNVLVFLGIHAGLYYGYSPADAGEDIRSNSNTYIYKGKCELKDKTKPNSQPYEYEAVFDMAYKK